MSTLCSQLSGSHLRLLGRIEAPIRREFDLEMAQLERWNAERVTSCVTMRVYLPGLYESLITQSTYTGVVELQT